MEIEMAAATKTRKTSPTTMHDKVPRGKKGGANQKGKNGAGLALVFIKDAEDRAGQELKAELSMKDRIKELMPLTQADHQEFRAALEARRDLIKAEADKAKITMTAYLQADTVARSLNVTLSLWLKMSRAIETGWQPNLEKAWGEISKSATDALDAQARAAEQASKAEEAKKLAAEAETLKAAGKTAEAAVADAKRAVIEAEMKAEPERAGPTQHQSAAGRGRPAKPLWDSVLELVKDRPIQDVEKLVVQLQEYIKAKTERTVKATPSNRPLENKGAGREVKEDQREGALAAMKADQGRSGRGRNRK
jgi:hypothetical protein